MGHDNNDENYYNGEDGEVYGGYCIVGEDNFHPDYDGDPVCDLPFKHQTLLKSFISSLKRE